MRRLTAVCPPSSAAYAKATADERRTGKHPAALKLRRIWQRAKTGMLSVVRVFDTKFLQDILICFAI